MEKYIEIYIYMCVNNSIAIQKYLKPCKAPRDARTTLLPTFLGLSSAQISAVVQHLGFET